MESARWAQIQELFHAAVEMREPERAAFLRSACNSDEQIMAEVAAMLAADSRANSLLDRGLTEVAYQVVGDPANAIPLQAFGPYRLVRILGEGGMGVVWLAERVDAGNLVAIKFLPHAGLSPARRERFAREIRTQAKLNHPYIARLYDAGTLDDGTPWFVMEYVEGERFTEYCGAPGGTIEEKLRVFRAVCEAVQYAHGQEIIHRDLKPSNILVVKDGTPRLLDFGIARELHQLDAEAEQTRPGLRFLSPDYAPPEWARDGVVGVYTDVYSLGVILYEMLTGQLPYGRPHETERKNESPDAHPAEKPSLVAGRLTGGDASKLSKAAWSDIDVLCLKAMHPDANHRYRSAEALLRDVDHFLNTEPLEALPDTLAYRVGKFVRRNRAAVLAAAATIAIVAVTTTMFTVRLIESRATALAEASRRERVQSFMLDLFQGGDKDAGPAEDLRVATLIDRGAEEVRSISGDPAMQADLDQTLGVMYQRLGQLDRADTLLQAGLHARQQVRSPDRDSEERDLLALGLLRAEQNRAPEAERFVREALAAIGSQRPANLRLLGEADADLGMVLVAGGKQADSVAVLKKAIGEMQSAGMGSTAEFARALGSLADAQMYLGNYAECEALNRQALAIDRSVYGENHPHIGEDLGNLAQVEEVRGHYAEAEQDERPALEIMRSWYGDHHPETARKMTTLASTLNMEGKTAEADELLHQALTIQEKAFGPEHPSVAYVLNALGGASLAQRKFEDAEQDYHRVITIYRSAYGDADYRVAVGMGNLASVYFQEGRNEDCERVLYDVVARYTKALGAANINTGMTEVRLGRTLLHEKKYAAAEPHTRAGYETLKGQTSAQTSYMQGAMHDLAAEYDALGRPQDAQQFRNQLAASNAPAARPGSGK
jgi:eukaryotic-like serine/threonine-protein kinase